MATWKKVLTEEDGNIGTANLTINENIRSLSLGNVSGTGVFSVTDNAGDGILTIAHTPTPSLYQVIVSGRLSIAEDADAVQGEIYLYENNTGGNYVAIKAPSLASSYTLTLPTSNGNSNQVLQTDGSGTLSWVDPSSGGSVTINSNTNNNLLTASGTANTINGESNLTFDGLKLRTGRHLEYQPDAGSRAGELYDGGDTGVYAAASGVTGGDITYIPKSSNTGVVLGRVYSISSAGQAELVSAANGSTNIGKIALLSPATASSGVATQVMYLRGMATLRSNAIQGTFAYGAPIYMNPTTAGALTFSQPSTSNQYVRRMGYAINSVTIGGNAHYIIWFDPSHEYIQIA